MSLLLTSWLDDVVLLSYSNLQSFKIMVLIDVDFLVKDIFALPNEVEAFDSHGGRVWNELCSRIRM